MRQLADALARVDAPLGDLALSANLGRSHESHRAAVSGADLAAVRAGLRAVAAGEAEVLDAGGPPRVVFLCTGAGPQAVGMTLADELVFREALHAAAAAADPHLDQARCSRSSTWKTPRPTTRAACCTTWPTPSRRCSRSSGRWRRCGAAGGSPPRR
ncbi:MAG: hypothetical protein R3F59_33490 [Myxococcota bacterium]